MAENKLQIRRRLKNLLLFLPNLILLLGRLIRDSRVPAAEKALFAAAVLYAISPLDFIPDFFPFIGQVDDLYLIALTLIRLIHKSDPNVVREHWTGGGDIVELIESIAALAPRFLPKRVSRVLSARVRFSSPTDIGRRIVARSTNSDEINSAKSGSSKTKANIDSIYTN